MMARAMKFDTKLVRLCEKKGWNQSDLARALGDVSKSTVSNWFAGKRIPDIKIGLKLARVLGVSLEYLADEGRDEPEEGLSELQKRILWIASEIGEEAAKDRLLAKGKVEMIGESWEEYQTRKGKRSD